jgi:DNA-binding NtrC family response regulator
MSETRILVVDDEKNIRNLLADALGNLAPVDTAVNGEDALKCMESTDYSLVFLDLLMPGMDGMEVLRRTTDLRPDIHFVIITAHGTIDTAVEALKLGAVDFLQKPFTLQEVQQMASLVLSGDDGAQFDNLLDRAKKAIEDKHYHAAKAFLGKAAALDQRRPEIFNLLGVVAEHQGEHEEAKKHYHSAYWINPAYAPSRNNLDRVTTQGAKGVPDLGEEA